MKKAFACGGAEGGLQTRSFLYIDECLEGSIRLMRSDCRDVINIGSDEMVILDSDASGGVGVRLKMESPQA